MEKVLIIDDERSVQDVLSNFLQDRGYHTLTAQSGVEGIEIFSKEKPPLVITDIRLPGLNGIEVLRQIKKKSPETEVVIVTGFGDLELAIQAIQLEASEFITKPFTLKSLNLVLKRVEGKIKTKRKLRQHSEDLERMVDEKTKQIQELEKQAVIGDMVQGIVHNINLPLCIIKAYAQLIQKTLTEQKEIFAKYTQQIEDKNYSNAVENLQNDITDIAKIAQCAERLGKTISTILAKSRQEQSEKPEWININDILKQELEFLNADLTFKHEITKRYYFDKTLPPIPIIYSDFSQVFINIIKNAIDAMNESENKEITITTEQDKQNIYVRFKDTGRGIPEQNIDKIFDPFFTTKPLKENRGREESAGTGLGLHTCLTLLKPYNATIKVESKVGEGSTFTVLIPKEQKIQPEPVPNELLQDIKTPPTKS